MKYHALQEELICLVARMSSSYPREEMIRHAREGSIKLFDAIILAGLIETQRPGEDPRNRRVHWLFDALAA